jgi:hypothetical protein
VTSVIKMYEGYYTGSTGPPDAAVDYRSPEILSRAALERELRARGVSEDKIESAFIEADKFWIPLPPRQ